MPGEPVETLFVELIARTDKLIEEAQRARDVAKKRMEEISKDAEGTEKSFLSVGEAIKIAFAFKGVQMFLGVLKQVGATLLGITQQAVGLASGMQGVTLTFNRLLGSEVKAQEFLEAMREEASKTGQSVVDMALAAKQFLPYAEGSKDAFLDMIRAQQGLAAADPIQGMIGAAFALREFLSGSYTSLAMRFELPKKKLAEITKMQGTMEEKMAALNQLLEEYGMGWGLVQDQLGTFAGQMGFLRGLWSEVLLEFGKPVFAELEDALKGVVGWVKENKEEIIATAVKLGELVATLLSNMWDLASRVADFVSFLVESRDEVAAILDFVIKLNPVTQGLVEAWGLIAMKIGLTSDYLDNISAKPTALITSFQQLGFVITNAVLSQIDQLIIDVLMLADLIDRIRRGEGIRGFAERKRTLEEAFKRSRIQTVRKMWGLEPTAKAPKEAPEEEPTEKAPPGLDEKAEKAALKGAKKIEDIIKDHQKRVEKLNQDHSKKLADIDKKYQKQHEKAIEKAQKSEADAISDYQKDLTRIREEYNREKVDEQEDFNRQWKRLIRDQHQEVIDAEWEFQFEEERLIAEGDTLALRELRLRYAHEKDVRAREQEDARSDMQEDRETQRQEREQDFRREMADRESQFQERMSDIQTQLQETLSTIAENAAEARATEQQNYQERMNDLLQSRDEKLQAVGESLMSEKDMNTETANTIMNLWREAYGDYVDQVQLGIDADQRRRESLGLLKKEAKETAEALEEIADADPWSVSAARRRQEERTGRSPTGRGEIEFAQHGLDAVFSRPTTLVVGEGGVAEHVRVTPLTGGAVGGGRVSVDVSGSINVTGSALSPEAANMLIIGVTEAIEEGISRRPD